MADELIYVPLQAWSCSNCRAMGEVLLETEERGILSIVLKLARAHEEKSPRCADMWGVGFLRLEGKE